MWLFGTFAVIYTSIYALAPSLVFNAWIVSYKMNRIHLRGIWQVCKTGHRCEEFELSVRTLWLVYGTSLLLFVAAYGVDNSQEASSPRLQVCSSVATVEGGGERPQLPCHTIVTLHITLLNFKYLWSNYGGLFALQWVKFTTEPRFYLCMYLVYNSAQTDSDTPTLWEVSGILIKLLFSPQPPGPPFLRREPGTEARSYQSLVGAIAMLVYV